MIGNCMQDRSSTLASLRRQVLVGVGVSVILVAGLGGWGASAELAGAVLAPGTVVVGTNLKKIQHPTGGVVGELRVRDGSRVAAGDVVMRLDETVTRANLAVVTKGLDELEGRRARLEAERDGADAVAFPATLTGRAAGEAEAAKILRGESRLFTARRGARAGQVAQLNERIAQLAQEVEGLEAQRVAMSDQIRLIGQELAGVETLYAKNLVTISRVAALQREAARLEGERGRLVASIAQAKGRSTETALQILQLEQDFLTEVLKELRDLEGKAGELVERKVAGEDQLRRVEITSPQDGIVHQLAVHTVGGVIAAGEVLMYVVPEADRLTLEARVAPQDIDQVHVGQPAFVRFTAFNQRTTPELDGRVTRIAADLTRVAETGESFYVARIDLAEGEAARLDGLTLLPGMPVEAHIRTGSRTVLSYLLKPLSDQIARAMREE